MVANPFLRVDVLVVSSTTGFKMWTTATTSNSQAAGQSSSEERREDSEIAAPGARYESCRGHGVGALPGTICTHRKIHQSIIVCAYVYSIKTKHASVFSVGVPIGKII